MPRPVAAQAKIYNVPYEPAMSAALAECWPDDCDCPGYASRNRRCCTPPNARVVAAMDETDVWAMFGLSAARVADERARNDTSWAPKVPSIWPDWWPDPSEAHIKKLEARHAPPADVAAFRKEVADFRRDHADELAKLPLA